MFLLDDDKKGKRRNMLVKGENNTNFKKGRTIQEIQNFNPFENIYIYG